jgi:exodeoxyribonuclease-5
MPTHGQEEAIDMLSEFVCEHSDNHLFILKGYAGTGKTTLVSALVNALTACRMKSVLLAPTGRAAKVFSNYAQRKAFTIHKHLYRVKMKEGMLHFARKENKLADTLFIVDEVSMIPDHSHHADLFAKRSLLEDLIRYVFEGENCKLLFIGDDAQLPPVHAEESPALAAEYLNRNFNLQSTSYQLTEVVRQALDSGILYNANKLRAKIENGNYVFPLFGKLICPDCKVVSGMDFEELLHTLYSKYENDDIVLITRSNRRAYMYNREIRSRILYRENLIGAGDYLMAVKNNYYWVDETSEAGFIANGDMMELLAIHKQEELYGFHFANVTVRLCDYPNHPNIEVKLILDSLESDTPSLTAEQTNTLYQQIALDYEGISNKRLRYLKIKDDPYLNAIQVKFGYSLTCHKTQGGQWKIVLIDQLFLKDGQWDKESLRWLYTAVTRATDQLYLIHFPDEIFEK